MPKPVNKKTAKLKTIRKNKAKGEEQDFDE